MNKLATPALLVLFASAGACDKASASKPSQKPPTAVPTVSVKTSAAPSPTSNGSTAASGSGAKPTVPTWSGTYQSQVAKVHPPEKVRDYTWKKDDKAAAVGAGKLTVREDSHQHLSGTASGALGQQVVSGIREKTTLRLSLTPKTPKDASAMTCTGTVDRSKLQWRGTLRCSGSKAIVVRAVAVDLRQQ